MRHSRITDAVEDFTFELADGNATLHVEHRPEGTTMLLVGPAGACRPSDLAIVGFDASWEPGFTTAYDVADEEVARLVRALETLEAGEHPSAGETGALAFERAELGSGFRITAVALAANGSVAVAGGSDGQLFAWDLDADEEVELDGHTGIVVGAAVSADGSKAATVATDDTVRVWNLPEGELVLDLDGEPCMGSGVGLSADGTTLVHVTKDGVLHVRQADSGEELSSVYVGDEHTLAVSADGSVAVTVTEGATRVWDLGAPKMLATLEGLSGKGIDVAMSADGRVVAARASDQPVRVWDAMTGRELARFATGYIWGVAISGDGARVMAVGSDVLRAETDEEDEETVDSLYVWDVGSGAELLRLQDEDISTISEIAMTGDGVVAVTGDWSNRVRLWRFMPGHTDAEPVSTPPTAPTLSEERIREAEDWYQQGYDSVFKGYEQEAVCYLRALEIDPSMRKAWSSLRDASLNAGIHDVVAGCDEAMRILDGGGEIRDFRDLLPMI
jgi:WD40 repeat protein